VRDQFGPFQTRNRHQARAETTLEKHCFEQEILELKPAMPRSRAPSLSMAARTQNMELACQVVVRQYENEERDLIRVIAVLM
jgi:hypothetical protein